MAADVAFNDLFGAPTMDDLILPDMKSFGHHTDLVETDQHHPEPAISPATSGSLGGALATGSSSGAASDYDDRTTPTATPDIPCDLKGIMDATGIGEFFYEAVDDQVPQHITNITNITNQRTSNDQRQIDLTNFDSVFDKELSAELNGIAPGNLHKNKKRKNVDGHGTKNPMLNDFSGGAQNEMPNNFIRPDYKSDEDETDDTADYDDDEDEDFVDVEGVATKSVEPVVKDDILMKTDLRSPLSSLRIRLVKAYGNSISSSKFYLNDEILGDESSLGDLCTSFEGHVQVQLSLQPGAIVIVDVVSCPSPPLSDDTLSSAFDVSVDNSSKRFKTEDVEPPAKGVRHPKLEITPDRLPSPEELILPAEALPPPEGFKGPKFVESQSFKVLLRAEKRFPENLSAWSCYQVEEYIRWVRKMFGPEVTTVGNWMGINGSALLAMNGQAISMRLNSQSANSSAVWTHLDIMKKAGTPTIPEYLLQVDKSLAAKKPVTAPTAFTGGSVTAPKPKIILGKYEPGAVTLNVDENSGVTRTGNNGITIHLWKFLLEILTDRTKMDVIYWVNNMGSSEGEFVMAEPEMVAKLWGERKNKPNMTYEKLSRALRYYKGGDILDKVKGKRFTYKFVCDLRMLVGYSASQLDRLVKEHAKKAGTHSMTSEPLIQF